MNRLKISDQKSRWIEKGILIAIAVGFLAWSALFIFKFSCIGIDGKRYFCLNDDAMISMRYGWNLLHGVGLVWNPGERIEGYSNPLMTLIIAIVTIFLNKSLAVLSIQIFGALIMILNACASMRIMEELIQNENPNTIRILKIFTFISVLSYFPLVFWSLMGMETGLLTLFLLFSLIQAMHYSRLHQPRDLIKMSLWMGLAFLTRSDSGLFALPVFLFTFFESRKSADSEQKQKVHFWTCLVVFFFFIVIQTGFRRLYYGEWVPNTYTLKLVGIPLMMRIMNGLHFIQPFFWINLFLIVLVCADVVLRFNKLKLLLFSTFVISIGYQIWIGGDFLEYWRFITSIVPLLFILFIQAVFFIGCAVQRMGALNKLFSRNSAHRPIGSIIWLVPLIAFASIRLNEGCLREIPMTRKHQQAIINEKNVNLAIAINRMTTEKATIGVFCAGTIPYYTGRVAIDFLGKSDKIIAHLPPDISGRISWNRILSVPGHNKYDLNYSIKMRKPTFVQNFVWGNQNLSDWQEQHYVIVRYKGVLLFLKKNSSDVLWDYARDYIQSK